MVGDPDKTRNVFVVHGRNMQARDAMFDFLRRLGLTPIEWEQAVSRTSSAAPYIGDVLDEGFAMAQAVVVLLTPDEIAYLRSEYADDPSETEPAAQARPNVLFEAGMAIGRHPERTVLVELGRLREISDVAGRHAIRNVTSVRGRNALAERLSTAGCAVDRSGSDWLDDTRFVEPPDPARDLPLGKRVPQAAKRTRPPVDVRYRGRGGDHGLLEVWNYSGQTLLKLRVELAADQRDDGVSIDNDDLPIPRLPHGKSASVSMWTLGSRKNHVNVVVIGTLEDGGELCEEVFVNLMG